jgi:hypothetical protein
LSTIEVTTGSEDNTSATPAYQLQLFQRKVAHLYDIYNSVQSKVNCGEFNSTRATMANPPPVELLPESALSQLLQV